MATTTRRSSSNGTHSTSRWRRVSIARRRIALISMTRPGRRGRAADLLQHETERVREQRHMCVDRLPHGQPASLEQLERPLDEADLRH